jgi:N-acetylneuraminic acid mutarotase
MGKAAKQKRTSGRNSTRSAGIFNGFEPLEKRHLMSTAAAPAAVPLGSSKLTGTIIGTSGSYQNQGNTIANVFDGNTATFFDGPSANGDWVGLNLGAPEIVTQVQYVPRVNWTSRMVGGIFQGSNSPTFSSGVTNLYTVATAPAAGVYTAEPVSVTTAFQYVRYLAPTGGYGNVSELEFDGMAPVPPAIALAPVNLTANATSPTNIQLSWQQDSTSIVSSYTIERQGPADASFVVIGTTGATVTSFNDTTAQAATTYSYEVIANNISGPSLPAIAAPATTPPMPANPWSDSDIGAVGISGSATMNANGSVTVTGGGADIWNTADAFNFDSQSFIGNGTIIAQVNSQTNPSTWAKSGLMIRETDNVDSRYVLLALTPGNGVTFQARTATHVNSSVCITTPGKTGVWLELVRSGSTFTGYASTNGTTWTEVGSVNIAMVNNVQAGMAVTAHNNAATCTATFSNVTINPAGTEASSWSDGATAMARWEAGTVTYNGQMYAFGGFIDRSMDATSEVDAYNPASNTWSYVTNIPVGGLTHMAVTLVGDTVYLAGGNIGSFANSKSGVATAGVLTYDLTTGVWGSVASLPAAVTSGGLVCINNQLIYYGGINAASTADLSNTWSLDLTNPNATWVAEAAMPDARNHIGYAAINGIAYAVGGEHLYNQTGGNDAAVDAYNPVTNVWTPVASLPFAWSGIHGTTIVVNNKIVIVGGQTNGGYDGIYLSQIEEFDPIANVWSNDGSTPEANQGESVAYINDELIVASGTVDNLGGWAQNQTWLDSEIVL